MNTNDSYTPVRKLKKGSF